jgi:hypothetical protein
MPNHVHPILIPSTVEGLGRAMGEAHRRTTSFVNARARWSGHLFRGRYASVAMDEAHLIAALRTVSLNPVRARLVSLRGRLGLVERARAFERRKRRPRAPARCGGGSNGLANSFSTASAVKPRAPM